MDISVESISAFTTVDSLHLNLTLSHFIHYSIWILTYHNCLKKLTGDGLVV